MLRGFCLILLIIPVGCFAGDNFNKLTPVASYASSSHGLVVANNESPGSFVVVFKNKSLRLNFMGDGFIKSRAKTPGKALLIKAGKDREKDLIAQAKKAFVHNKKKIIMMGALDRLGYRIIRYTVPIYSGSAILSFGARIIVKKNGCRWMWETKNEAVVSIHIFQRNSQAFLAAVMYSVAPDGNSPSLAIFQLVTRCHAIKQSSQ